MARRDRQQPICCVSNLPRLLRDLSVDRARNLYRGGNHDPLPIGIRIYPPNTARCHIICRARVCDWTLD